MGMHIGLVAAKTSVVQFRGAFSNAWPRAIQRGFWILRGKRAKLLKLLRKPRLAGLGKLRFLHKLLEFGEHKKPGERAKR